METIIGNVGLLGYEDILAILKRGKCNELSNNSIENNFLDDEMQKLD
jgi:hypothetical protein